MLDCSESNLLAEIEAAREHAGRYLHQFERSRQQMAGPAYRNEFGLFDSDDDEDEANESYLPRNMVFEWMSNVLPRMAFQNPTVCVKSRRRGSQRDVAKALGHAERRLERDQHLWNLNRKLCGDFGMAYFVAFTAPREVSLVQEFEDPVYWPHSVRISPKRFFWDPQALTPEECRFYGHLWTIDHDDLIKIAAGDPSGWKSDVIGELSADDATGLLDLDDENVVDRHQVTVATVWVPEKAAPGFSRKDGYNGCLYHFALTGASDNDDEGTNGLGRLISPDSGVAYYGPRWGPYTWCGAHVVPDETAFLAPLTVAAPQIRDHNRIVRRENTNAQTYRELLFINDIENIAEDIEDAPNRSIFSHTGLQRDDIVPASVGGNSQQGLAQLEWTGRIAERAIALDDAQVGVVTGQGTATEVNEAAGHANIRVEDLSLTFQRGIEQMVRTRLWYLYHDDRVYLPLDDAAAEDLGMDVPVFYGGDDRQPRARRTIAKRMRERGIEPPEPWLLGGDPEEGSGSSFDDLEIEIEAYSMERLDPQVRIAQAQGAFQALVEVGQVAANAPYEDWKEALELVGKAYNVPDLGDYFDERMYAQLASQGMLPQGLARDIPMLGRDLGKGGRTQRASQGAQQQAGQGGAGRARPQPGTTALQRTPAPSGAAGRGGRVGGSAARGA